MSDDEVKKRREMLAKGLQKKKECENKASAIVESFTDNVTDRETIRNALNDITQSHYDDIVTERSIEKKCGYVICQKQLKCVRTQKYHINTKTNEVLDLTERKKFCGELCFRHSNFLRDQILTSPLWLREEKDHKKYIFKDEEKPKNSKPSKDNSIDNTESIVVPKPRKKKTQVRSQRISMEDNTSEMVFNIFKQWWTKDSTDFLKRDFEVSKEEKDAFDALSQSASKYSQVSGKGGSLINKYGIKPPKMPSECLEKFKKVEAFYKGTTEIDLSDSIQEIDLEDKEPVLPQIDKIAQKSLRKSIVLEGFQKAFDSFSDLVELKWSDIRDRAKSLVSTFNLTADNIVLRPNGWMVATGILIHFLAIQNVSLKSSLEQPFFKQLFSKVNYDGKHVSIFVDELINLA